jgi:lipopolysaccharide transport system permease protein
MIHSYPHLFEIYLTKLGLNLRAETSKTYLGYVWWVLEPAMYVAVLYFVFGVFLARGGSDFVAFLVCGKVPFLWFSKTVVNSNNSILGNRGLINQVAISKAFFPLLVVGQDLIKQAFVFSLMFGFLLFYGIEFGPQWFWVTFVMLTQLLLIIAASLCAALATAFVPDVRMLISTGMVLLMFGSGIFYDYKDIILPEHQSLFLLNPLASLINSYRMVLLGHQAPDWNALISISLISLLIIALMLKLYTRTDNALARLVTQ